MQHVGIARLWVPDELPWWIVEERLRPLYEWIRALYRDERRLPVMVVTAWHGGRADATVAERELIQDCLRRRMPLLNIESAAAAAADPPALSGASLVRVHYTRGAPSGTQ